MMSTEGPIPAGKPTFYAARFGDMPSRRVLGQDIDCDVLVIGGGFAGLWTAHALLARGRDVVVVEREMIGAGASGRNAGFVGPGYAERPERIVRRVGLADAQELWRLSVEGVEIVRRLLPLVPGMQAVGGRLTVRRTDHLEATRRRAAWLQDAFGVRVDALRTRQVRASLRSPLYFQGLYYPDAFHLDPLALINGLAAQVEAAGGRIFEGTQALSADLAGLRKHVTTRGGRIRAEHVILAGGAPAGAILPAVSSAVMPVTTFIGVTEPLGTQLDEAIGFRGAVADTRRAGNYFRRIDDRLLWGAGFVVGTAAPGDVRERLARDLGQVFPSLAGTRMDYAWAGTMAYAVHRMPQIGPILPGVWLAGALGGHGLNTAAMAGERVAAGIVEGDDRWKLFAPFGVVSAGGGAGRMVARASMAVLGWRERMLEARSRERAARM